MKKKLIVIGGIILICVICIVVGIKTIDGSKLDVANQLFTKVYGETEKQANKMMSFDKEDMLMEWLEEAYREYFTSDGWEDALKNRIPLLGVSQYQAMSVEPENVEINIRERQGMENCYIATIKLYYVNSENASYDIPFQLTKQDGKWLIDAIER